MSLKKNKTQGLAAVKAALAQHIDKAVADRMANLPTVAPVVANAAPETLEKRLGKQILKAYVAGPGANDLRAKDIVKAMTAGGTATGAELAPQEFSEDVILAVQEKAILGRIAGATYDNYVHSLSVPKIGAQSVSWVAEGSGPSPADAATSTVELESFRAVAAVKVSGELLRRPSSTAADGLGRNMVNALASAVDAKLFSGAGTSNEPNGIFSQIKSANITAATAAATTSTAVEIEKDLVLIVSKVRGAGHELTEKAAFVMPSKEFYALMSLRHAVGNKVFPMLDSQEPRLLGHRVYVSNGVSGVTFIEGSQVILGLPFATGIQVQQLSDDAMNDAVTCFGRVHCDAKLAHDTAAARLTGTATKW